MQASNGTIKHVNRERGFGFIQAEDRNEYFFHRSNVQPPAQFKVLEVGAHVTFVLSPSRTKPGTKEAANVRLAQNIRSHSDNTVVVIPYGFVPVDASRAVKDKPVWHDGSGGGELLSGEILCSLKALTPLLPGNARYPVEKADTEQLRKWRFEELPGKKQIAEPLRLDYGLDYDRVVIAGSALKGMIRHSLSGLLSAPMERVKERLFTYRPNLNFAKGTANYTVCPAVIKAAKNGGWDIQAFDDPKAADFRSVSPRPGYSTVTYKGGIDGQGLLANAFGTSNGITTRTYNQAHVPSVGGHNLHIPADLYERYLKDQSRILANDTEGHLTAHPLEKYLNVGAVKTAIEKNAPLQVNQLIYVEVTTDANGAVTSSSKVVSFGHHFRYRWPYTSSVREKNRVLRDCLKPTAEELTLEKNGAPHKLTGARLIFGYVRDKDTSPIGKGVFERLAGRVAINHAVSENVPNFLGEQTGGYCVPLPILGQPKPSAWEFYLRQDGKTDTRPATYGDLPGDAGGDLTGHKYFRHQTYDQAMANIQKGGELDEKGKPIVQSEHATLARFICDRGTRFKFAIRFVRMREWELGALFAALEPGLVGQNDKTYAHKLGLGRPLGMGSVKITIKKVFIRKENETVLPTEDNRAAHEKAALSALKEKLTGKSPPSGWLEMHEFPGTEAKQKIGYPMAKTRIRDQNGHEQTIDAIYAWHTDLRRKWCELRREKNPNWSVLKTKIPTSAPK